MFCRRITLWLMIAHVTVAASEMQGGTSDTENAKTPLDMNNCFSPSFTCPNSNVTFLLYTRANQHDPYQLEPADESNLKAAPFVDDRPIKILIHGYTGHRDFSPNTEIRPAYLSHAEYNVISVDWSVLAAPPCYLQAAKNAQLVGMCTANLTDELIRLRNFPIDQFHVIGFSLGAQVAGQTANYFASGKFRRITGLDPALPLFASLQRSVVLDRSDAYFVDVIHTNVGNKGKYGPNGHVDFYVNGGGYQPGCDDPEVQDSASCAHARAPMYYAESITSKTGFWGRRCSSWMHYTASMCSWNSEPVAQMGEYADPKLRGQFFLKTNSKPPYAMGENGLEGPKHLPENYV